MIIFTLFLTFWSNFWHKGHKQKEADFLEEYSPLHLASSLTQPPAVQAARAHATREAGHVPRASSCPDPLSLINLK